MTPTTEPAYRIAAMFHRRMTTAWSPREIKAYKMLVKSGAMNLEDLSTIERYYAAERKKGDKGIYRRDIQTFLNNFHGELDRARAYAQRHPITAFRKVKEIMERPPELTDEQIAKNKAFIADCLAPLKRAWGLTADIPSR